LFFLFRLEGWNVRFMGRVCFTYRAAKIESYF
jgi:hypothetical protein